MVRHSSKSMEKSAEPEQKQQHKCHKPIFISYSMQSSFTERKFVLDTISQLKQKGLSRYIWLDSDDCDVTGPDWFIARIKAAEKSKACVIFMSDTYFADNSISLAEGRLVSHRQKLTSETMPVYLIIYRLPPGVRKEELGYMFHAKLFDMSQHLASKTPAEKATLAAEALYSELKKLPFFRSMSAPPAGENNGNMQFRHHYRGTKMCQWSMNDVLSWLADMDIHEADRMKFREKVRNTTVTSLKA